MVQEGTIDHGMTAAQIERSIEARIRSGLYADGDRLPTVRELSAKIGVNKNTAVRAYHALERKGFVELVRGRGAFVRLRGLPAQFDAATWRAQLDRLLSEARLAGLDREIVLREMFEGVDRSYGKRGARIAFIECNAEDMEALRGEVSAALKQNLDGVLLHDLQRCPESVAGRYDALIVTFYHLSQVYQALSPTAAQKVIGVHTTIPHDALLNIARLQVPVIGLVCEQPNTAEQLTRIIHTCHPSATVLPALIDEPTRIQILLSKVDAIVVARSCHERLTMLVTAAMVDIPVIPVRFTIDQLSIDVLRRHLQELMVPV